MAADKELLGKSLIGEIARKNGNYISMVLHDTSTDVSINLNKKILDSLDVPNGVVENISKSGASHRSPSQLSPVPFDQAASPGSPALNTEEVIMDLELAVMKELVPVQIPGVGSYFDVHVTLAANPTNFMVQSWIDLADLEELNRAMNAFYSNSQNRKPFTKADTTKDT